MPQTISKLNAQIPHFCKEDSKPKTCFDFQSTTENLHGWLHPNKSYATNAKIYTYAEGRRSKYEGAKGQDLPDLKEILANEAKVFVSWNSLMLFFKDFLLTFSSDIQHWKQFIFLNH